MGLYDRDYLKERRNAKSAATGSRQQRKSPAHPIYWVILAFMVILFGAYRLKVFRHSGNPFRPDIQNVTPALQPIAGGLIVYADSRGHYRGTLEINGVGAPFIVDTGATFVTVPRQLASQAGLQDGEPVRISTGGGEIVDRMTVIERLTIGNAELVDVPATINEYNREILVGMSALKYFTITQNAQSMTLVTGGAPSGPPAIPIDPGNTWANAAGRHADSTVIRYAPSFDIAPPTDVPKPATAWTKSVNCDASGHCRTLYH
jgi:aspartyl protease family protein